ncbi:hypothetical protein [Nocardia abscessus]|uniref:hypothetical protein n=1 Tax=Nocardia abscessus TaxID=120957 RepID=UPI0024586F09|nr:hypothetical protein [Nocardia abscessus]
MSSLVATIGRVVGDGDPATGVTTVSSVPRPPLRHRVDSSSASAGWASAPASTAMISRSATTSSEIGTA